MGKQTEKFERNPEKTNRLERNEICKTKTQQMDKQKITQTDNNTNR
jgi:hypothetical protein